MTGAGLEARTLLWEWIGEREDPDPEQRAWKVAYCEGMVDACEHTGLLAAEEIAAWRALMADGAAPAAAPGDAQAAERHLERLVAMVPPLSRDPDPEGATRRCRFHGALDALRAAGIVSDADERRWRSRAVVAEAPWLGPDEASQLAGIDGLYAISIPPTSPAEEAADAAAMREIDALCRRGEVRRVFLPDQPERRDGLAIVAVVTRTDATEVVFHHVGEPEEDGLAAPALADDLGIGYEPVTPGPVSSHGSAGPRRRVMTGAWRYQPAAPDAAAAFSVALGTARWQLTGR